MAEVRNTNPAAVRRPSRLQRRAPASIEISPVKEWNVAIPLLTPLVQSPISEIPILEIGSKAIVSEESAGVVEKPPSLITKMWMDPAAPFTFEPETPFLPFLCTGNLDR